MPGFHHADITKGIMISTALLTLSASIIQIKPYLHLQLVPHMTKYHQFWRIPFHTFAFQNSTELLMGLLIFSNAGCITERAFGPRKYASFVILSIFVSTLLNFVALIVGYTLFRINRIPAGPYGLLFSLLWQRHRLVPVIYEFRIGGITFSSKQYLYLFAGFLVLSDPPSSLISSANGLLTGYIYRADHLPILLPIHRRRWLRPLKTYKFPSSLYILLSRFFTPLMGTSAPPRRSARTLPGQTRDGATMPSTGLIRNLLSAQLGQRNASAARAGVVPRTPLTPVPSGGGGGGGSGTDSPAPAGATEGARQAMGEWVSEMTGRSGARAPTEEEIGTMFPNIGREAIVRALQRNDHNTALAVEALLQEGT